MRTYPVLNIVNIDPPLCDVKANPDWLPNPLARDLNKHYIQYQLKTFRKFKNIFDAPLLKSKIHARREHLAN
jgi:hypothetical protein